MSLAAPSPSRIRTPGRIALAALLALTGASLPALGQSYDLIIVDPQSTYGLAETSALDISDGGLVLGSTYVGFQVEQYSWTEAGGFQSHALPLYERVNDHFDRVGSSWIAFGSGGTFEVPATSPQHPIVKLRDITNAQVVVGMAQQGSSYTTQPDYALPVTWDPVQGTRTFSVPWAKSLVRVNDSGLACGERWMTKGTPLAYTLDLATGQWDDIAGQLPVEALTGVRWSSCKDVNSKGQVVGECWNGSGVSPYVYQKGKGFKFLPGLKGGSSTYAFANAIDDQGRVVGRARDANGDYRAFLWTEADGMLDLNDVHHLAGTVDFRLHEAMDISESGEIIGRGFYGAAWGPSRGFILTVQDVWSDLAGGTAGVNGTPELTGSGSLLPGSTGFLQLAQAAPNAPCVLLAGTGAQPVPFLGGTLGATPILVSLPLVTGPGGDFGIPFTTPPALPSAVSLVLQCAVADASVPAGATLSNGLQLTTP